MRRRRRILAALTVLVLVLGTSGFAGWRWWHNRAPYGPEVLGLTATLELVDNEGAAAALGPEPAPRADVGDRLVLGRVSWRPPAELREGALFWIVVLDKRTQFKPTVFGLASPRQDAVGMGSHGYLQKAVDRYPWLWGAAGREHDGYWTDGGSSIYVAASDATPVTFVGIFPDARRLPAEPLIATAPVAVSDLLVAFVYMGPDGQLYWAHRVLG